MMLLLEILKYDVMDESEEHTNLQNDMRIWLKMTNALGLASKDMQSHMEKYAKRNCPIHSLFITPPPPPQHKHHPLQRIQVITECPWESTSYRIGCTYFRSNKVRIITKQMYG